MFGSNNITTPVLYGAVAGAILGNVIPTPGDALCFYFHRKLRDQWTKGEITSKEYWSKQALAYYTLNASWWALVLLVIAKMKGDTQTKIKVALGMAGFGAVIGVILKNIQKDDNEALQSKNGKAHELYQQYAAATGTTQKTQNG